MTPSDGVSIASKTLIGLIQAIPAEQTAVIAPEQNIRITYGGLRKQVQAVAEALAASGVNRGDRVGIAMPNGLPNIVAFLAASQAGTAAPLNPAYKEDEFRFYLEDTSAKVLLLPPEGLDDARAAAGNLPILTVEMDATGTVSLRGVTGRKPVAPPDSDDIALILHTSGSTGRPKRVPLSHANLSISAGNVARSYALSSSDVSLCVMPSSTCTGSSLRRWRRWRPAAPSSCRRSSARCRSGRSRVITGRRGTRRCRRFTNCCWRA